jgi:NADPH-dependent 2,4-dienoyl-CoA reductase/sulfur reductase-like enzyme
MGPNETQYVATGDANEFHPDNWKTDLPNNLPKRGTETNLNVLVVGAGPSGLMTALECWRKGHNVVGILERSSGPTYTGDP